MEQRCTTMRNEYNILLYVFLAVAVISCSHPEHDAPFRNVVAFYKEQGDTLKLRAAEYLKASAGYHYGVRRTIPPGISGDSFIKIEKGDSVFKHYLDSLGYKVELGKPVWDLDVLTDSFLIDNIELAFDSWKKPWARDLSFDQFCRYVLPYRNGDEVLSNWRRYFKHNIILV